MRLLDRLGVGTGRKTEDGIRLLDRHVAARRPGAAPRAAGSALAGELVAPIGVDAVEIGLEQPRSLLVLRPALAQQRQEIGRAELLDAHAAKAAAQDGASHAAGVVVEGHAQKISLHTGSLA